MRFRRRTIRLIVLFLLLASTLFAVRVIVKEHDDIANYVYNAAKTELALQAAAAGTLTADVLEERVNAALDASDVGLARSYHEIAIAQGHALSPSTRKRLDAAGTWQATTLRKSAQATRGCLAGDGESVAHISGAVLCDLTVFGDVRDLTKQAMNHVMGRDVDQFILALSGIGLTLTAGTYATAGAAAPAKLSISLLKFAKNTGRLSKRFGSYLAATAQAALPAKALREHLGVIPFGSRLTRFQFNRLRKEIVGAFRRSVAPKEAARLEHVVTEVSAIKAATTTETAVRTLKLVDSPQDLTKLRRISEISGGKTLAYADTFGKSLLGMMKTSLRFTSKLLVKYVWAAGSFLLSLALAVASFLADRVALRPLWALLSRP